VAAIFETRDMAEKVCKENYGLNSTVVDRRFICNQNNQ